MKENLHLPQNMQGFVTKGYSYSRMTHPHRHDELEFNIVLRGSSSYLLDNRRYFLGPDTVVWLFPQQDHILLDCSSDFEMWIAVVHPALLKMVCVPPSYRVLTEDNPSGYFCKRISPPQTAQLDQLLSGLAGAKDDAALFNTGLAYALTLAWSIYSVTTQIPPNADIHPAVENAAYLLKKNPELGGLDALASRAGLSPARLSRLFKQQIGVSIVQFRNRLRIERFVHLYQKGRRRNIMQAALDAGFGSYPQFHREFLRVMGCNPAEFRRRNLGS